MGTGVGRILIASTKHFACQPWQPQVVILGPSWIPRGALQIAQVWKATLLDVDSEGGEDAGDEE
jgi:hypothetical protein